MKKKVLIAGGAVVVLVATVLLLIFVFSKSGNSNDTQIALEGTWLVASKVTEGVVEVPEKEYIVFEDGQARDYSDGSTEPSLSSAYEVKGSVLNLKDVSRTYQISVYTDSYISLYTSDQTFISLVKVENVDAIDKMFDTSKITDRWNVVYRSSEQPISNEYFVFEDGVLSNFRNDEDKPAIEADYSWSENIIEAPELGMKLEGIMIASDMLILVDINTGYVWILQNDVN